jgi:phage gpG-like protein
MWREQGVSYQLDFDTNDAKKAAQQAFRDTALILAGQLTQSISDPSWDWPNEPSPRDIVDTGRLRSSQTIEIGNMQAEYAWPVEYAEYVHDGVALNNGTVLPARPWIDKTLEQHPPEQTFDKLLRLG